MERKKKKIKVHGLISLYETSAVGIGAYPDAHLSHNSFSLCKALTTQNSPSSMFYREIGELNKKEVIMEETEETKTEESEVTETPETKKTSEEESTEKTSEEETSEESEDSSETEETEKSVKAELAKAISELAKQLKTERGLVEKENKIEMTKKALSEMSLGELAVMQKDSNGHRLFSTF